MYVPQESAENHDFAAYILCYIFMIIYDLYIPHKITKLKYPKYGFLLLLRDVTCFLFDFCDGYVM